MRSFLLISALLAFSLQAFALEVEYFNFTNSKTYALTDDALLENSVVDNNYPWMLTAAYNYVKTPLTIKDEDERTADIIKSLHGLHLGGGYRLTKSLFIGAKTYAAKLAGEDDGVYMGDTAAELKWRFWQGESSAIAVIPTIYLPTGTSDFTTNNGKVGESLALVFEHNMKWIQFSLVGGFVNRPGATLGNSDDYTGLNYKQAIYTAIGAILPLTDAWALNVETYRYNNLKGNQHPNEFYFGARNQTTSSVSTFLGLSLGGFVDETSNDYRLSAGIKYTPFEEKEKPAPAPQVVQPVKPRPAPVAKKITREEGLQLEKDLYGKLVAMETIYFGNGSSKVDPQSRSLVRKFRDETSKISKQEKAKYTIVVEGFASKTGNPVSNMKLSQARIAETEAQLKSLGINPKVIKEVAYGDSAADMTISEALNRKVMLRLYRNTTNP